MSRDITISVGDSRKCMQWKSQRLTRNKFFSMMERSMLDNVGAETHSEYMAMTKAQQDSLKDVGGFVGGTLREGRRGKGRCTGRDLITLDLDNCEAGSTDKWIDAALALGECIVYSTRKHCPDHPRLRVIFFPSRTLMPDEYQPAARMAAKMLDSTMRVFDPTTFEAERLMYWPSRSADTERVCVYYQTGNDIDVDDVLLMGYTDWQDVSEWPVCPSETVSINRGKQADPASKSGVVGAFCRVYDIRTAIDKFLPGVYTEAGNSRMTYAPGSTQGGALIYNSESTANAYLYSHHGTDPAGGRLCNAWDLVRIHLYGDRDTDANPNTPPASLPSWQAMKRIAESDADVAKLLAQEDAQREATALDGFEVMAEDDTPPENWRDACLAKNAKGAVLNTIENVVRILRWDEVLSGRIWEDSFAGRIRCRTPLPWCADSDEAERDWQDCDDAGLRWYIEKNYHVTGAGKVMDGVSVVAHSRRRDPVREYLDRLTWDETPRLDTLFIDYLGAEDTPYTRAVTRKMFVAGVARTYRPGCKFDQICILSGRQGIGKSLLLSRMGREWFNDSITSFDGKEARENLRGVWIIELGEMTAFSRSESEAAKQFLSQTEDRYRAAYGRRTEVYKRRCVFFGTSNATDFLRDTTGNRRFWPIDCDPDRRVKRVHEDLTDTVVDQIWAEAVVRFRAGEPLILGDELQQAAITEQQAHTERDPWAGDILAFLERLVPLNWAGQDIESRIAWREMGGSDSTELTPLSEVCVNEVWRECVGRADTSPDRVQSLRIAAVLNSTPGWVRVKESRRHGPYGRQRVWRRIN